MKITLNGVTFSGFRNASPGRFVSSFTDVDGATLLIDTATLIAMYELVKYDLSIKDEWEAAVGDSLNRVRIG